MLFADSEDERAQFVRQMRALKEGEGIANASYSLLEGNFKHLTAGRAYLYTLTGIDKYEQRCVDGGTPIEARVKIPDGTYKVPLLLISILM